MPHKLMVDLLGYAASFAVLTTFLMRTMLPLRLIAILSNVLFLAYGYAAHINPVFFLHMALLPINTVRLVAFRGRNSSGSPSRIQLTPNVVSLNGIWLAVGILAGGLLAFALLNRLMLI